MEAGFCIEGAEFRGEGNSGLVCALKVRTLSVQVFYIRKHTRVKIPLFRLVSSGSQR